MCAVVEMGLFQFNRISPAVIRKWKYRANTRYHSDITRSFSFFQVMMDFNWN